MNQDLCESRENHLVRPEAAAPHSDDECALRYVCTCWLVLAWFALPVTMAFLYVPIIDSVKRLFPAIGEWENTLIGS